MRDETFGSRPASGYVIALVSSVCRSSIALFALVTEVTAAVQDVPDPNARAIDFNRDIRPIFSDACFTCHGPDSARRKAGLRLDRKSDALAKLKSGRHAIVPGDLAQSAIIEQITTSVEDDRMPPLDSGRALTPAQIELLRRWIKEGANWQEHWAYLPPSSSPIPGVRDREWVRNEIDSFILARLEHNDLSPAPEADRATLARRLSLDLTGLPPTPAQVHEFELDLRPDAYDRFVEELLSSPAYGERMASIWLDLARYADTDGFTADERRSIWPYRDWVINAYNSDMPFDQFTVEQIAGDLLPNATLGQRIATGFHRNTMVNNEAGFDPEQWRVEAIFDRVATTATIWLGTTMACARCHDHKYDPFTQHDYYQLFAYFNNTAFADAGAVSRNSEFQATLPPPRFLAPERNRAKTEISRLEKVLVTVTPELQAAGKTWEKTTISNLVAWSVLEPVELSSEKGTDLTSLEDRSILASGPFPDHEVYRIRARPGTRRVTAFRLEALTCTSLLGEGSGRGANGDFVLTGVDLELSKSDGASQSVHLSSAYAEYSQKGYDIQGALDQNPRSGWSIGGSDEATDRQAIFVLKEPLQCDRETLLQIKLKHESALPRHLLGRFRLSITGEDNPLRIKLPLRVQRLFEETNSDRSKSDKNAILDYYLSIAPELQGTRDSLARERTLFTEFNSPSTLVMKELPTARKTQVFIRGNFLERGAEVQAGVPSVLHPLPSDQPTNRLALAKWLISAENPLVGRVTVNRLWMHHFGVPLVNTPEDFGNQGSRPEHPELLDWLALEFMRRGWSQKAMHRLIVHSATYRQASRMNSRSSELDPLNRLHGRGPRFRMEAEMIRDNALSIGGLLSSTMHGPSVFPPQPEGLWQNLVIGDQWRTSTNSNRYRRAVYTFLRRTIPYPFFSTFDAPNREAFCVRRIPTSTPLQALNLSNDPVFFEAAAGLAKRILSECEPDLRTRVRLAWRLCTARWPDSYETGRLTASYQAQLKNLKHDAQGAEKIAQQGEILPSDHFDPIEFAAWKVVALALLNLDETITRP